MSMYDKRYFSKHLVNRNGISEDQKLATRISNIFKFFPVYRIAFTLNLVLRFPAYSRICGFKLQTRYF